MNIQVRCSDDSVTLDMLELSEVFTVSGKLTKLPSEELPDVSAMDMGLLYFKYSIQKR